MYHPCRISIADNVFIWHYTIIDGTGGVEIGEGTQIGAWVGVFTHSSHIAIRIYGHYYNEVPETEKKGYPVDGVKIGKYVFVGAGSKILPGVTIGDGALISSLSLVNRDVKPFEIVTGNPAIVIGDTRDLDKKYLDDPQLERWYKEWQSD
jgi:acetyltransferase-like isoleucine patch superfamily enzyme